MTEDIFPSTRRTWIDERLAGGAEGRLEVNRHVMALYAHPLAVYFLGSPLRSIAEAEEAVDGFFADRLAREDFFSDWRRSEMPLRRWLMNAFSFYLMELSRNRRRDAHAALPADARDERETPERAFDRAFAEALVQEAMRLAREACEIEGLGDHWRVFVGHHYEGKPYAELVGGFQVTVARAAVMARTAARRFQAAVRGLLARDGLPEERIDDEIRALLEVTTT